MFEIAVAVAEETRPGAKRGGSFPFALLVVRKRCSSSSRTIMAGNKGPPLSCVPAILAERSPPR
jgi:hypothetical protein